MPRCPLKWTPRDWEGHCPRCTYMHQLIVYKARSNYTYLTQTHECQRNCRPRNSHPAVRGHPLPDRGRGLGFVSQACMLQATHIDSSNGSLIRSRVQRNKLTPIRSCNAHNWELVRVAINLPLSNTGRSKGHHTVHQIRPNKKT